MQVAIDKLPDVLCRYPHFDALQTLCVDRHAWLVGGALRDALLGRPLTDLDLIFPRDPTPLARRFAQQIGGYWFWLDKERRQSRVLANRRSHGPCFDFALFRAKDLHGDLVDRDFTINAIALPMHKSLDPAALMDPFHGLADLQKNTIRMVSSNSLANDPLRILKGVRHATSLHLQVDPLTLVTMQQAAVGLDDVAAERVRQEVWKIFADPNASKGFDLLTISGAGEQLFGGDFTASCSTMSRCLEQIRLAWHELSNESPEVRGWLEEELEQGLCCETLLLWSLLLFCADPHLPLRLAEKWHFSRRSKAAIDALAALDTTAFNDLSKVAYNERAFALWADQRRLEPKLLLLALVAINALEKKRPQKDLFAWAPLVATLDGCRPTALVDGHWLRQQLGIADGPEMNGALQILRNAEISGRVGNQEEARQFLLCHFQNKD